MVHPDHQDRSQHQHAVGRGAERPRGAAASASEDGQALALEAHVPVFVAQDLLAQRREDRRAGGRGQGLVVDLGDDLGGDEDADRKLEPCQLAHEAEDRIGKGPLLARDALQAHEPAEISGVAVLLGDEETEGDDVVRIVRARGPPLGPGDQVFALGALAELELGDGRGDGLPLGVRELGAVGPGQVHEVVAVGAEVAHPLVRGHDRPVFDLVSWVHFGRLSVR